MRKKWLTGEMSFGNSAQMETAASSAYSGKRSCCFGMDGCLVTVQDVSLHEFQLKVLDDWL